MSDLDADGENDDGDVRYKDWAGKFINTQENVTTSTQEPYDTVACVHKRRRKTTAGKRRLKATAPASSSSVESRKQKAVKSSPNV